MDEQKTKVVSIHKNLVDRNSKKRDIEVVLMVQFP